MAAFIPRLLAVGRLRALPVAACLTASLLARASVSAVNDTPIELPTINVTADRPLPEPESWRYARIPGLEVLSDASDRDTQKLLRDLQLFNAAIDVVWPGLKSKRSVPLTLIVGGSSKNFMSFVPDADGKSPYWKASVVLRGPEQAVFALNFGTKVIQVNPADADAPALSSALAYADFGTPISTASVFDSSRVVDYHRQLNREYVRYLMSFKQPRLPVWLEEGLSRLLVGMKVYPKYIEFAKVEDPNLAPAGTVDPGDVGAETGAGSPPTEEQDFNATLATKGFIPLGKFFAVTRDSPEANSSIGGKWSRQAEALVHLWLYGEGKRFNPGFAKFVTRSAQEPLTEAMFKECFGMGYTAMLAELRTYVSDTAYSYREFHAKAGGGIPEPAPLALRDATGAEIGRIKGEAQILAGHADQAREEMLAPYIRGERDAASLAALGLLEKERGDGVRARKLLEAAVQQKVGRTRAYVALAELRLAEMQPGPDGPPLTAAQTERVLQPLLAGRTQVPAMPELYELMAEVWLRSDAAPTKEDLALLNQAVAYFPSRPVLLLRVAELDGKYGEPARAHAFVELGLKLSRTPEARSAFEELKAALPPAEKK